MALLILKKIDRSQNHNNPALFWTLIVLVMLLMAGSIRFFNDPSDISARPSPSNTPESTREPRVYTVTYKSGVFSPTNLRIHSGDTVRFKNDGFFGIRIVSDPAQPGSNFSGFDSVGDIPQGSYFSYTLSEKGIFGYHNGNNPDEQGTIIVR
jgi:plastocyanin